MVQSSDEISVEEEDSRSGERKTVNNYKQPYFFHKNMEVLYH